jgi:hypothetical protein
VSEPRLTPEREAVLRKAVEQYGQADSFGVYECLAEIDALNVDVARLTLERDRLRAALEPFAAYAKRIPDNWPEECPLTWEEDARCDGAGTAAFLGYLSMSCETDAPRVRDYRRAAEALAPPGDGAAGGGRG